MYKNYCNNFYFVIKCKKCNKDVDNMFQIIIRIIAVIIALIGVTLIYDSRIITKNFFGFGDQNEATTGLKIIGFFMAILGAVIAYVIK